MQAVRGLAASALIAWCACSSSSTVGPEPGGDTSANARDSGTETRSDRDAARELSDDAASADSGGSAGTAATSDAAASDAAAPADGGGGASAADSGQPIQEDAGICSSSLTHIS